MPERIRFRVVHALRFALPTLLVVYALGTAWNALDVFVLGDADPALGAAGTFRFDEHQWRIIAAVMGIVVFLWKLGDMARTPPSWRYAILFSVWLAVATVWTAIAMTHRNGWLAVGVVAFAVASWLLYRRRLPGRPVRAVPAAGSPAASTTAAPAAVGERDLR